MKRFVYTLEADKQSMPDEYPKQAVLFGSWDWGRLAPFFVVF